MTRCPACDRDSSCSWRCDGCGRDLVGVDDDDDPDAATVATDGGENMVWVRIGGGNKKRDKYHTDPECRQLQSANNSARKSLSVLHDDIEHCSVCAGEVDVPPTPKTGAAVKAMAEMDVDEFDDLVTDGGRATATTRDPRQGGQRAGPQPGDRRRDGVRERGGVGDQNPRCQHTPPGDAPCAECLFDNGGEG